jgi:hypothetical protein
VDRQYKLIDKHTVQIIVPFDKKLFEDIRSEASNLGMSTLLMKKAAPITVSSYDKNSAESFCQKLYLRVRGKRMDTQESIWYALGIPDYYDNDRLGLNFQSSGFDGIV